MNSRDFTENRVISGRFGELWLDNDYVAEIKSFEATIDMNFEDVAKPRKIIKGKKLTDAEAEGEITLNKISSRFTKRISDNLKQGKQTVFKAIVKLDDPDAFGQERIVIYDLTPTELDLINFDSDSLVEQTIPFFFTDHEFIDSIEY